MNYIFIHIAAINNYIDIINDMKNKIIESGLIYNVESIYLCISGKNELKNEDKFILSINENNLLEFEFPTLEKIKNHCVNHPDSNILYLHMKGISEPNNLCLIDWRNYMLYFLINKYEKCLDILKNHDTCGVDLRLDPAIHYSGNFWWTTAKHINTLPQFKDMPVILSERHKAEFWICQNGKNYSLWDCGINQFERHLHRYPEIEYKDK